ncbi:hypothetical protein K501DRAFT_278615 [Backusella circina FSU 941]|nr:hypothetical protein K501DRAFT_278615 [Backusella circina FSU 941]
MTSTFFNVFFNAMFLLGCYKALTLLAEYFRREEPRVEAQYVPEESWYSSSVESRSEVEDAPEERWLSSFRVWEIERWMSAVGSGGEESRANSVKEDVFADWEPESFMEEMQVEPWVELASRRQKEYDVEDLSRGVANRKLIQLSKCTNLGVEFGRSAGEEV